MRITSTDIGQIAHLLASDYSRDGVPLTSTLIMDGESTVIRLKSRGSNNYGIQASFSSECVRYTDWAIMTLNIQAMLTAVAKLGIDYGTPLIYTGGSSAKLAELYVELFKRDNKTQILAGGLPALLLGLES